MKKPSIAPPMTIVRIKLEEMMRRCTVGDQLTWDELATASDLPRDLSLHGTVGRLSKKLRSDGLHFITRRGIGIELLSDDGAARELVTDKVRKAQRCGRALRQQVEAVDLMQVSVEMRGATVGAGVLGALIEANAKPKIVAKFSAPVDLGSINAAVLGHMTTRKRAQA